MGAPFRHQGTDPATGVDCRGLLLCVARSLDYSPAQAYRNNYARQPDSDELRAALETELEEIPIVEARDGDVLFIRLPREAKPTHVGIIAEGPYERMIIHAKGSDGHGKVTEDPLKGWMKYVAAAYRFRGLAADVG